MDALLSVRGLEIVFETRKGKVKAVNGVSYDIKRNEVLAIVGESGSGKTVSAMSLLRLIPEPPGRILDGEAWFDGIDLLSLPKKELRHFRGKRIGVIFQDPMSSLNPVMKIGDQVRELLELHTDMSGSKARKRVIELLNKVGLPNAEQRYHCYPHELSGGMRQRIMIAMALSCNPDLLIADEATTALDVTVQAGIVKLVKELSEEIGMSVLWITHDFGLVASIADRVAVMYGGRIVEEASLNTIYHNTLHPYTQGLIKSIPQNDRNGQKMLRQIDGVPPNMIDPPTGCTFHPRCPFAINRCSIEIPPTVKTKEGHKVACWVNGTATSIC